MQRLLISIFTFLLSFIFIERINAQTSSLIIKGGYLVMNGGQPTIPIYLVINNADTSAIYRTFGHIISENQFNIVKWNCGGNMGHYEIPFGYSTSDYLPLTFNKTSTASANINFATWGTTSSNNLPWADASSVAAVTDMNSAYGGGAASVIDRWWDINTTAATSADITFSYRGAENTMTIAPNGILQAQHWNGNTWDAPVSGVGNGVQAGIGTFTANGISNFSPWVLVSSAAVLPISLLSFDAQCFQHKKIISWQMADENGLLKFELEKSLDGLSFENLSTIPTKSISNSFYTFTDNDETTATVYYRLKFIFENEFSYSKIIALKNCDAQSNSDFSFIAQNNFSNQLSFKITNTVEEPVTITVYDALGKLLCSKKLYTTIGLTTAEIETNLSSEIIFIQLTSSTKSSTKKLAIIKN